MAKNYMTRHNTNHTGFTIVELLIVIVIISILAVVAILTFGTIRERAIVSSIETGASAYMRAIQTYRAEHEHFPLEKEQVVYAYGNVSVYGFCVGAKESYPNPTKGCGGWTLNNKPTDINKYKPTDGFHREILKTIVNQSSPRFDCFYTASNGSCARGYVFLPSNIPSGSSRLNGQTRAFFGYFLPGKQSCQLQGELAKNNRSISSNIIENSVNYVSNLPQDYTVRNSKVTLCLYAM